MNRLWIPGGACTAALLAVLGGCGEDAVDPVVPPPPGPSIDVRDGAWLLEALWSPCDHDPFVAVGLDTLCAFTGEDLASLLGRYALDCTLEIDGAAFTIDCSGREPLGDCTADITASGTGAYTDTTLSVIFTRVIRLGGQAEICGALAPCTTYIDVSREWLAPARCTP